MPSSKPVVPPDLHDPAPSDPSVKTPAGDSLAVEFPARPAFTPWREDYRRAAFLLGAAALAGLAAWHTHPGTPTETQIKVVTLMLSAVGALGAGLLFRRGLARSYGKRVEVRALKEVQKLVSPDIQVLETDVPVPPTFGGGDADLLIGHNDIGYVVEIKSHQNIALQKRLLGPTRLIRVGSTKAFKKDPFRQVTRHAQYFGAQPVVWFPKGRVADQGQIGDVLVVIGSAKDLLRALHMPRKSFFG